MMTRRKFLGLGALALPAALGADVCIEPTNLRVRQLTLRADGVRFVHFSDFHFKGDGAYADHVVRTINDLQPEFVCFTGDLVEDARFAREALGFIQQIQAPVYGSPGNHDYWSHVSFPEFECAFEATGGAWLVDRTIVLPEHDLELVGMAVGGIHAFRPPRANRQILLLHYPEMANALHHRRFDLILAGHSHGGQVRLPFLGALIVPHGVGPYDLGYYNTPGGPLYVNAGIGTYRIPVRWNCRPEITVMTI
ncbi:MAG: metallophosphoesterase [Chthoniobacterales bacterium]